MLVVDNSHAYVVIDNEVKSRKNHDFIAPDVLANEILSYLPPEERTVDKLLEELSK